MQKQLIFLVCIICLVSKTNALNSTDYESIANGLQLATQTVLAIKNNDFKSFINAFATISIGISSKLGVYGNAFALVMSLINLSGGSGENQELAQIQKSLNDISSHLDSIQIEMNKIAEQIIDEIRITDYKLHKDQIVELEGDYHDFLNTPNEVTKNRFLEACKKYSMIDFLTWFHNDLTQHTEQPIMSVVLRNLDRKKMLNWSKMFAANVMQANFLHIACVPIINPQSNIDDIRNTLNADAVKLSKYADDIKNTLQAADNYILSNFWTQAQSEIDQFLIDNRNVANKDFVQPLYDQLSSKYDWKAWSIASYNGDTSGFGEHTSYIRTTARHWLRVQNRNLFVAAGNSYSDSWLTKANTCEANLPHLDDSAYKSNYCSSYQRSEKASRLAQALDCCVSGEMTGVLVVKAGHDFWVQWNRGGAIFSYDNSYSHLLAH